MQISVEILNTYGELKHILNDAKLAKAWDSFQIDFNHEFEKDQTAFTCNIDHFFWNAILNNKVLEAGGLHLPDNLSEHSPIYCKLTMQNRKKRHLQILLTER